MNEESKKIVVLNAIQNHKMDDYEGYVYTSLGRIEYIDCFTELYHNGFIDMESNPEYFLLTPHGASQLNLLIKRKRKSLILKSVKVTFLVITALLIPILIAFRDDIWNFIFR
ncbi:MAG: hypothetical protein QNK23_16380 [Crocinitomicaceae bacterium]|nr:hypothetical protein [Crocinitomicaceae bacterium]